VIFLIYPISHKQDFSQPLLKNKQVFLSLLFIDMTFLCYNFFREVFENIYGVKYLMKQIHDQEKEQFKKLFKQEGIDRVEDRFNILEVFLQTEKHVTEGDLVDLLDKRGYRIDRDFVCDTLKLMCYFGFARKNSFDNGDIRYEHRHLGQHHDHMVCTKCRKIIEFSHEELEALQARVAETHQFHMLQHRMEIYGICSDCAKERVKLMPLVKAKPGEKVVIDEFTGGSNVRVRLSSMGLRTGDVIEVVTNHFTGQVVVAVEHKRYVLGRGLAKKIMVRTENGQKT
jgi:Fur family ferric uptake transcriptional regulator